MLKGILKIYAELYFSDICVPPVDMSLDDNTTPETTTDKVISALKDVK